MPKTQVFSGKKLRKARESCGLSRARLCTAIKLYIGMQTLIRYERGDASPNIDTAGKIAAVLGVKVEDLMDTVDAEG